MREVAGALSRPAPQARPADLPDPSLAGLTYAIQGRRLGPLPIPAFLAPRSRTLETIDLQGRFTFDVHIALPWGERLVHYRGWLRRETAF